MLKVCVVTLYKHNYGAFLQAYALQKILEDLGYEATVLDYDYYNDHAILGVHLGNVKKPVKFVKLIVNRMLRVGTIRKRDRVLEECAKKKIKQTTYYASYKDVQNHPPQSDIFIVGSDQVWNPSISEQGLLSRLLEFVRDDNSIICSYAASVGVKKLSEPSKQLYKKHLSRFDCISVREKESVPIIKELVDQEIDVNVDPALLLEPKKWDGFAEKITASKPYLFLYLAQKSPELIAFAEKLANDNGWDIVNCHGNVRYHVTSSINGNRYLSPMEFVGGIRNAAYVVTNSFHCLVFTIHYQKKAYVKTPPNGASRLRELIERMKLERLTDSTQIKDHEEEEIYKNVSTYLDSERIRSREYLLELKEKFQSKSES
ncbi:MAG: polysaccharide pyruvyl transferase family protein [Ruminococcus flavefaciens]